MEKQQSSSVSSDSSEVSIVEDLSLKQKGKSFWLAAKWPILFLVTLDPILTAIALSSGLGYEGNIFLAALIGTYGLPALFIVKAAYLVPLYVTYKLIQSAALSHVWLALHDGLTAFGVILVINNCFVLLGYSSLDVLIGGVLSW